MPGRDPSWRITADGKVYRKGRKNYPNRDFYEGEFLDGLRHGRGMMKYSNADMYNGEFEQDMFHGFGVYQWAPFEDDDGNTILDTVSQIIFPPDNSAETARQNATKTFTADDKLFRSGKKDTLLMTEINFVSGGYWATQWWYNIPPVGTPPAEYDFTWVDPINYAENSLALDEPNSARFAIPGTFEAEIGYNAIWLVLSGNDLNGVPVDPDLFDVGDEVTIRNESGNVLSGFEVANSIPFGDNVAISIGPSFFTANPPNPPPPAM